MINKLLYFYRHLPGDELGVAGGARRARQGDVGSGDGPQEGLPHEPGVLLHLRTQC